MKTDVKQRCDWYAPLNKMKLLFRQKEAIVLASSKNGIYSTELNN
jgi:hypothetical protein